MEILPSLELDDSCLENLIIDLVISSSIRCNLDFGDTSLTPPLIGEIKTDPGYSSAEVPSEIVLMRVQYSKGL